MLATLVTRLRSFRQRRRVARELDEELQFHVEMETQQHIARGVPPVEARRLALRDFGGLDQTKEAVRDVRASWIDARAQDVRHALRALRRGPLDVTAVVAMLALGIGVTTAMFTLVDALILRPAPFHEPDQLARLYLGNERGGRIAVPPVVLHAWRDSGVFAAVESATPKTVLVRAGDSVASRGLADVTPGLFEFLGGVRPIRGRLFDEEDGGSGTDGRVLVSEDLWRSLYGADSSLVGSRISIDDQLLLVVGILPSDFRFPSWNTMLWRANAFEPSAAIAPNDYPHAYIRFSSQRPREDALRLAADAARAAHPGSARLWPRPDSVAGLVLDGYYARAVPLLAGGVVLVFVILCANASGLLLGRLTMRRREFALRTALGANRRRLIGQAWVESSLLGAVAVIAGIVIAWGLVSVARGVMPDAFLARSLNPLNIDLRTLVVTSAAGVIATLAAGLLPAWLGTRVDVDLALRATDRAGSETRMTRAVTRMLLVGEVALTCTLLIAATALVRSFMNLTNADRGMDASRLIKVWVSLNAPVFPDEAARTRAAHAIEAHIHELPGIRQTAWSFGTPPSGGGFTSGEWRADATGRSVTMKVDEYWVGPNFFVLYGIPLLLGRAFEPFEPATSVIVGERFARALWPDRDPIGQTFNLEGKRHFEVIALAREIHLPSLNPWVDSSEIYGPFAGVREQPMLSIRCAPICPEPDVIRAHLRKMDSAVRINDVRPVEAAFDVELARPRATAALAFAFAAIAIVAAAGGLFSVLTYAVGRRRQEFGVRAAMGATPRQIRHLVLRDGLVIVLIGASLGAIGATSLTSLLASLQYGVTMSDPVSTAMIVTLLGAAALLASWWPAAQAMRADPVRLLRDE